MIRSVPPIIGVLGPDDIVLLHTLQGAGVNWIYRRQDNRRCRCISHSR